MILGGKESIELSDLSGCRVFGPTIEGRVGKIVSPILRLPGKLSLVKDLSALSSCTPVQP